VCGVTGTWSGNIKHRRRSMDAIKASELKGKGRGVSSPTTRRLYATTGGGRALEEKRESDSRGRAGRPRADEGKKQELDASRREAQVRPTPRGE